MIRIDIAGFGLLEIQHVVLDFNGTIAVDGVCVPGVAALVDALASRAQVHVLTADTFGTCRRALEGMPVTISVLRQKPEDEAKLEYVEALGPLRCAAVGNGRNDRLMLQACALGIAVLGGEGAALDALTAADVVVADSRAALELLAHPVRLTATLRM
jgi:soluble P-type ATPase